MTFPDFSLDQVTLQLHRRDNVAISRQKLEAGMVLVYASGERVVVRQPIPTGHKLALRPIAAGENVIRYGFRIGQAACSIQAGDWVHTHNLEMGDPPTQPAAVWFQPDAPASPAGEPLFFQGYLRPDGRVGTRNYLAVIASSQCSANAVLQITRAFSTEKLAAFPQVDAVIPILHHSGCSIVEGGLADIYLERTLTNLLNHPNIAAALVVELGCEVCQVGRRNVVFSAGTRGNISTINIQETGGLRKTIAAGIQAVEGLLPQVNACRRSPQPLSKLTLALQCGGSDAWSGVTANPLVGLVADALVRQGGTAVLAETPEIYGAEHLLTGRAASPAVSRRLLERLEWWHAQARLLGFSLDNNPTPGNKEGGLTTILEKSLGAVAKGGSTPLQAVYEYAERISAPGLVFMDTPGNDPASLAGELAGGCNLILFTTGRGTVYSTNIAPCIKIASNTALFERMPEDIDFNAGQVFAGISFESASAHLLQRVIQVAGGEKTQSEQLGLPEVEFVPWQPGAVV